MLLAAGAGLSDEPARRGGRFGAPAQGRRWVLSVCHGVARMASGVGRNVVAAAVVFFAVDVASSSVGSAEKVWSGSVSHGGCGCKDLRRNTHNADENAEMKAPPLSWADGCE